jgi:hypothetical protein
MFHGLPGVLVSGKVLSLAVLCCCRAMGVRSHLVKFSRSLVRIICHICPVENDLAPDYGSITRIGRSSFDKGGSKFTAGSSLHSVRTAD